jgi:hypothetical protein
VFSAFLRALARFVCDIPIFFALLLGLMRFAILVSQDCKITLGQGYFSGGLIFFLVLFLSVYNFLFSFVCVQMYMRM